MNRKKITTKALLVEEIKQSIKKIEQEKIFNSVHDFTEQLHLAQRN